VRPPEDIEPAALFLSLLDWPAPRCPIAFRFADVEASPELWVRAVPGTVWLSAAQRGGASVVLAAALCGPDGAPIFASPAQVGSVVERQEMARLEHDVIAALQRISPHYWRCDLLRWDAVLKAGADACYPLASAMASCHDVAVGWGGVVRKPRPDRYWGCAVRELLDGHHMAFRAAFDTVHPPSAR
jgi:hypothetical protein